MKILIISDTHRRISPVIDYIERVQDIDQIIHLGDVENDVYYLEQRFPDIKVTSVLGNNDYCCNGLYEDIIDIGGYKAFITHGHKYSVKSGYERVISRGRDLAVDIIMFGHTHMYYHKNIDNIEVLNPGSAGIGYEGKASAILMEIDRFEKCHFTHIKL